MVRLRASKPFVASGNNFLWFCLATRETGIAGSIRLGIADRWTAQDLDNAVAYRLLQFDNEVRENTAKLNAEELAKVLTSTLIGGTGGKTTTTYHGTAK